MKSSNSSSSSSSKTYPKFNPTFSPDGTAKSGRRNDKVRDSQSKYTSYRKKSCQEKLARGSRNTRRDRTAEKTDEVLGRRQMGRRPVSMYTAKVWKDLQENNSTSTASAAEGGAASVPDLPEGLKAVLPGFLQCLLLRLQKILMFVAKKLGLSKRAVQKQMGNFSVMAAVGKLTSKVCVYDPSPTTPIDTIILLCKALANFLAFYTLILFIRVLLTWFPNIDWDKNPWLTLRQITDPYLNIFRNMVPPLMGQIDLTPIVGFLVMQYITSFIKFLGNRFISIDNFSDGWGGVFFFEDDDMYTGLFEDQNAAPTAPPPA
jgi:uncharacterized protein YggT (Ycf19 family)